MTELPRIISVDDHVIEPAHLFETWLPRKYRECGPQPLTAGIGELASPHTKEVALDHVKGLDDETVFKLMRGNAIRMLDLDL